MLFGRKGSRRTFYSLSEKNWLSPEMASNMYSTVPDGQLTSMVVQDMELLESPLRLNLWRALLANELDNWNASSARSSNWKEGYGYTVATEMYSAGIDRLTHQPLSFRCPKPPKAYIYTSLMRN